jgi:hypothetical protein
MITKYSSLKAAIACAAIGWMCWHTGNVSLAQNSANSPGLSPDLQEVVKLSQARMPDDVIKNYINSTGKSYRLSADDIVYLNQQGVSAGVISALQTASSAYPAPSAPVSAPAPQPMPSTGPPPPVPPATGYAPAPDMAGAPAVSEATPPPPPEVNFQYFHDQLAPYGAWINVGGVTYWRPDQAIAVNPDWRPYYDMGQWVQTDNGLYWQSDYTWGDIPFHYGRWVLYPGMGWLWAPDYTWGPAWVFWRQDEADAAIGWAPLPVGAVFINGGFFFNGVAVGLDFDFGLGDGCFVFVGCDHFHEGIFRMRGREWAYHIDRVQIRNFYAHSVIRNDFRRDDHGRFVNDGIGRDRVEKLTHVEHASFEERNPVGDRNRLAVQSAPGIHRQSTGGPVGAGHAESFNAGAQQNTRGTEPNNGFHDQSFGPERTASSSSVSKVYRPPAGGSGHGPGGGGSPQKQKN